VKLPPLATQLELMILGDDENPFEKQTFVLVAPDTVADMFVIIGKEFSLETPVLADAPPDADRATLVITGDELEFLIP
jgi:hypothetical protein